MRQYHIDIEGCEIAVKETQENGIPVVFIHGNSLSSIVFEPLLNSEILEEFRLISFDLPGHGESQYSSVPVEDYSLPGLTNILKKVMIQLFAENAILIGHSLGGHIILESLEELSWIRGVGLIGTSPYSTDDEINNAYEKHPVLALFNKGHLEEDEILTFAQAMARKEFEESLIAEIKKSDYKFRKFLGNWFKIGKFLNESEYIRELDIPVAMFYGEHDKIISKQYINDLEIKNLWKNEPIVIPNASHTPQLENQTRFILLLNEFIESILHNK
ncbi:alpha/beta fold hydrolase [Bacteroidota bacterium]